jgi:hypothetical protein
VIDFEALKRARSDGLAVCGAFTGHPLHTAAVAAAATACRVPMDLWHSCLNDWAIFQMGFIRENPFAVLAGYAAKCSREMIGYYASKNLGLRDEAEVTEYEWQMEQARQYLKRV